MGKASADFYSVKNIAAALAVSASYLVLSFFLIGFKTDQLFLVTIFNACFFISRFTRKLILGFSIFIVYWILFDYMKAFPNYKFNAVHIEDLYKAEKWLFGIRHNQEVLTPNEYWIHNSSTLLDVLCGFFYLCWIPVPLAFAGYLFFKDRALFLWFSLTFVLVNFIGFICYYIYPAAPPWYMQQYGADFTAGTPGNTAGLARFDNYFGVTVFKALYAKSSNVFAAMPSLHSSYPVIVLYYGVKKGFVWMNVVFAIVMVGIWFTAVYSSHHYVLDVIAGVLCAVIGLLLFRELFKKSKIFRRFFHYLLVNIS
jgi:inositol phosphorylceramide synthase catalytic subunit